MTKLLNKDHLINKSMTNIIKEFLHIDLILMCYAAKEAVGRITLSNTRFYISMTSKSMFFLSITIRLLCA